MSAAEQLAPEPFPGPSIEQRYRFRQRGPTRWDHTRRDQRTVPSESGPRVLQLLIDTLNQLDAIVMDGGADVPSAIAHALGTLGEAAMLARFDAGHALRVDMSLDDALSVLVLRGAERVDFQAQVFASGLSFLQRRAGRGAPDPMKVTTR